jgi:hypothetical protein
MLAPTGQNGVEQEEAIRRTPVRAVSRRTPPRVGGAGLPCGAMDIELTDDEHLRALAVLEAVVGNNDDDGLAVLAGGAGERCRRCWPRTGSTRSTAS